MSFRTYLSPPDIGPLEEEYVLDALRSGWVAPLGPHVDAFEREIADFVGVEHAVAFSSGTAGLHLGLLSLGIGPGDEVVVPTLTFAATAFAVSYTGARPIFMDSEPESYNLDPDLLTDFFSARARSGTLPAALIVVDVFGQTADYERILPLCEDFGVPVLEDSAEAIGATNRLGKAGGFGRAGVFSFNGNKIMTTGGGGMLVSNESSLAARVRSLANQSRMPKPWYEHEEIGYNYRLSNVSAAIGRAQLRRLPEFISTRTSVRRRYTKSLMSVGVELLQDARWGESNAWLSIAVLASRSQSQEIMSRLAAEGYEARNTWKPMHLQPVFRDCPSVLNGCAESLFERGLCLPSGSQLDDDAVDEVVSLISSSM